jgi:hypothetical protein
MRKYATYGSTYNIIYKPHPVSYKSHLSSETEELLLKHSIPKLPADLPIEALLFAYPDVYIGGYFSSIFFTITGDRVKFLITKSIDSTHQIKKSAARDLADIFNSGYYCELYQKRAFANAKLFWA